MVPDASLQNYCKHKGNIMCDRFFNIKIRAFADQLVMRWWAQYREESDGPMLHMELVTTMRRRWDDRC